MKVSYSCTPNMKNIISAHNSKILNHNENPDDKKDCNCPRQATCPLDGHCLATNVVYQATVAEVGGPVETYIGGTAPPFKMRLGNHIKSFRHLEYSKESKLSIHIWSLKRRQAQFDIKWRIISRVKQFNTISGVCPVCTEEKYQIIFNPSLGTLNKRDEMKNHCRHRTSFLLDNT